jgi:hypothetical protein
VLRLCHRRSVLTWLSWGDYVKGKFLEYHVSLFYLAGPHELEDLAGVQAGSVKESVVLHPREVDHDRSGRSPHLRMSLPVSTSNHFCHGKPKEAVSHLMKCEESVRFVL